MNTYEVTLTYQYTHTITVEADSRAEAITAASYMVDEDNCNNDDSWYNAEAREITSNV